MFLADDLESIAQTRQHADQINARARLQEEQEQAEWRDKVTIWRHVLCWWPLLPLPVLIMGEFGAILLLAFVMLSPGYAAWTAFGSIAAGIGVYRRAALARIALATNLLCFVAVCAWLIATYIGRAHVSF
jgi:hypothetical protein